MSSYQSITVMGHLGKDPEKRATTTNGKSVANFSVAVSEKRGGDEQTEWFRCVAWEKTADVAAQYLHRGDQVLVVGRLQTRKYTDKDNMERSSTDLVVDRLVLMGAKKDASAQPSTSGSGNTGGGRGAQPPTGGGRGSSPPPADAGSSPDECPF
jgi:single-strand DNA-binding protein